MTAGDAKQGALNMIVFGLATLPSLLAVNWLSQKAISRAWSRSIAAVIMMIFGFQFAMRGFTALGWMDHLMLGQVMLW
jgi:sulfite exporter TauE/SafE